MDSTKTLSSKTKTPFLNRLFKKEQQSNSVSSKTPMLQITESGGLGDKYKIIESIYGDNQGHETWGRYKDNAVIARFNYDRVIQFMIDFNKLGLPKISVEEADNIIRKYIPTDSELLKTWSSGENQTKGHFYLFKSEMLKQVMDHVSTHDLTLDCFTVILTEDETGIYMLNIVLGEYSGK